MKLKMKKGIFKNLFFALMAVVVLVGCGGSDDGGANGTTVNEGVFLDSAVEGLNYLSGGQSGITDTQGTFKYEAGKTVKFSIGDIVIGEAKGKTVMTPVDLVSGATDETNQTVANITAFLMTFDDDSNANNGITIATAVRNNSTGLSVDFGQNETDFGNDSSVLSFLNANSISTLVSTANARTHLRFTLRSAISGRYQGTFSGDDAGSFTMNVDCDGNITGTATGSEGAESFQGGTSVSSGNISGLSVEGTTFSGAFTHNGGVSGTWNYEPDNDSGKFSGSKDTGSGLICGN